MVPFPLKNVQNVVLLYNKNINSTNGNQKYKLLNSFFKKPSFFSFKKTQKPSLILKNHMYVQLRQN